VLCRFVDVVGVLRRRERCGAAARGGARRRAGARGGADEVATSGGGAVWRVRFGDGASAVGAVALRGIRRWFTALVC